MTITSTIGTSGRTYSLLQSWEDAIPATPTDHYVGEAYKDTEFTGASPLITFAGTATSASATITLKCAAGQSFYDNANKLTNQLKYDAANGVALRSTGGSLRLINVGEDYVTIDGIQLDATAFNGIEQTVTGANCVFKNLLVESSQATSGGGCLRTLGATVINSLAINTGGGTGVVSNGNNSKFRNVTSVQLGAATFFGFRGNYDSPLYLNCAAFGFGTCFRSGSDASSNYNASGDTSAPGANSIKSKTFANQFVDVTNTSTRDFRVKAGADLINAGTRDATYTNDLDIVKQTRSTTTPTIGAWEYVVSGGGGSFVPAWAANSNLVIQRAMQ